MTVQLEYTNHLLQFFKNISYYAGIMLNAFSHLLCSKLCWHDRLVPTWSGVCDPLYSSATAVSLKGNNARLAHQKLSYLSIPCYI